MKIEQHTEIVLIFSFSIEIGITLIQPNTGNSSGLIRI